MMFVWAPVDRVEPWGRRSKGPVSCCSHDLLFAAQHVGKNELVRCAGTGDPVRVAGVGVECTLGEVRASTIQPTLGVLQAPQLPR